MAPYSGLKIPPGYKLISNPDITSIQNPLHDTNVVRLIDQGKWREVFTIIQRQNKNNKSITHTINKALLYLCFGTREEAAVGLESLVGLIKGKDTFVTSVSLIEIICYTVTELSTTKAWKPDFCNSIWECAVSLQPHNPAIIDSWFKSASTYRDWESARKVALRGLPKLDNKYTQLYRAMAASFLEAEFGDNSEKRSMALRFALGFASRALKATPELVKEEEGKPEAEQKIASGVSKSDVNTHQFGEVKKSSQTVPSCYDWQDLQLLLRIYEMEDREEVVKMLADDDSSVGIRSKVVEGEFDAALKLIKLYDEMDKTDEQWSFCYQLLCDAAGMCSNEEGSKPYSFNDAGDDFKVWKAIVKASAYPKNDERIKKLDQLFEKKGLKFKHRLLAKLDLMTSYNSGFTTLTKAFKNYFATFLETDSAYNDTWVYIARLSDSEQISSLVELAGSLVPKVTIEDEKSEKRMRRYFHAQLNYLKMKYHFEILRNNSVALIQDFTASVLAMWHSSLRIDTLHNITDRRTGDDAAVLAACSLIMVAQKRDHRFDNGLSSEYTAIIVLEKFLEYTKHHYGAILLLIRLYLRHALWDRAHELYLRLDIKNQQIPQESWVLLQRAATMFSTIKSRPNKQLYDLLKQYTEYLHDKDNWAHKNAEKYEAESNYSGFVFMQEYIKECNESFSRATLLAELSRFNHQHQLGEYYTDTKTILAQTDGIEPANGSGLWNGTYKDIFGRVGFPFYPNDIHIYINTGPETTYVWVRAEQMMYIWQKYAKSGRWVSDGETAVKHEELAEMYFEMSKVYAGHDIDARWDSGLTTAEGMVANLLASMSALMEYELALVLAIGIIGRDPEKAEEWFKTGLFRYEMCWKHYALVADKTMKELEKLGRDFAEAGGMRWGGWEWQTFHSYYKVTELFVIYPKFLLARIQTALMFKQFAQGFKIPFEEFDSLADVKIENRLRGFMRTATKFLKDYAKGATDWNNLNQNNKAYPQNFTNLARYGQDGSSAIAIRRQMLLLCDMRFTLSKVKPIIEETRARLLDLIEDTTKFRKGRWSKDMLKYAPS